MPLTFLDQVDFATIPTLRLAVPIVASDPAGYQAGLILNSTDLGLKYHNGTSWITLGPAGAGGPPSGAAGGDLSGSYPSPQIAAGVIVDADVNATAAIAQSKVNNLVSDLAAKQATNQKGQPNGYAPLDGSNLIPNVHIPPLAVTNVFTAASDAEMIALAAQLGDMCIRTDVPQTFVLAIEPASVLGNWKQILAAGQVTSVNGKTGVVTITLAELGGAPTTRSITAGNGLTGGGDLSADRTLNVVGDATLNVTADQVAVVSAPKWTTTRNLSLTGGATGSAMVDGTADVSIAVTVPPGGHTHPATSKSYSADVGGTTSVAVVHNLNSTDVGVSLKMKATGAAVMTGWTATDANTVTLTFAAAPAAGSIRCTVFA